MSGEQLQCNTQHKHKRNKGLGWEWGGRGGEGKERGGEMKSEKGGEEGTGKVNVCMGGVGEVLDHPLWHL